jgi:hypothetical protein
MGWAITNNSSPAGTATWFQGNATVFPSHIGDPTSYIGVNFNSVAGANTISNWLLTPEFMFNNGDSFSFWTRVPTGGGTFPDRLEVRWSGNGGSTDVGTTATSVGDFDTLLLSINPDLTSTGYPEVWTQFTVDISGLSGPTSGRLAFRYFVTNGGPSGANSNYIGIDTFEYTPAPPTVLYDNGPFITSFGDGPGGSDVSLLQNISLGMTTLGAGVQFVAPGPHNRIADEFEVTTPGGWTIDNVVFYGYQTGSTTTSSFTGVNYRIWDGPPNDPNSNIIFGDETTNRFESTDWTGAYRFAESSPGTTRPVMQIVGEAGVHLMPGTYWLDWQLAGTIASGPWQPPITMIGQNTTGNALQLISTGWGPFLDGGAGTAQGVPFQLWGNTVCDNPSDVSWISVDPDNGMTAPGEASAVAVTLDSTGVPAGDYTAYLCLHTDDPSNPLFVMPVNMSVVDAEDLSFLQVAHLAPFAMDPGTAVTITLNGAPALTDFAYGDSTGYIPLMAGAYDVAVWPAGSSGPAITATVDLMGETFYSAIAIGDGANQDLGLILLEDDLSAPAAGNFKIRLGHLAPFAPGGATADVRLKDGTPILPGVEFGDVTSFIELPAGEYNLIVTTPGGDTTLIDPIPVAFGEGDIVSGFATGEGNNQPLGVFAWPPDMAGFFVPLAEYGYVRVAHLAPFAADASVTVALNGAPALTDFGYGDSTTYIELPVGMYDVEIIPTGTMTPAITATLTVTTGMYYSVVAYGDGVNQDLGLLALEDDNSAPAAGKFHLRLGHLAPFAAGLATADVRLQDGTPVAPGVNFLDVTPFLPLDAGTYDLKVTTPGGADTLIDPLAVALGEGSIITAFAAGDGVNQSLGVFAWPVDEVGFFLPMEYRLLLPIITK